VALSGGDDVGLARVSRCEAVVRVEAETVAAADALVAIETAGTASALGLAFGVSLAVGADPLLVPGVTAAALECP
jgi:hypothetical protein